MRRNARGFTIIELLVVIAVIGILTSISIFSFTKYQANTRDSQRSAKVNVISEALEKYYDHNGEYPSCSNLTQTATTVNTAVLPGIDPNALITPKSVTGDTNSIKCIDITTTTSDIFSYVGDNSANCKMSTGKTSACLQWTLQYREEGTGNIVSTQSRRKTLIATSGTSAITATPAGFTQINLSWTNINNATSYQLQRATDAGFTANVVNTPVANTSSAVTGLAYNTNYYFRVAAIGAGGDQSNWSNVANATTWNLVTPNVSAVATTNTTFTSSWPAVTYATSYNVQCSWDGSTWSGCLATIPGLSMGWGPVGQGTRLWFRTQAVNGSYTSAWSSIVSATGGIDAPAAYTMDYGNTSARWNFVDATSNAVCPAGTTPSYDWYGNGVFWVSGTQYKSVSWQFSDWNQTVTLTVASRCITSATSSGFVWANNSGNGSLTWPTAWVLGGPERTMQWGGTCPTYTTAYGWDWRVMANRGGWTASGSYVQYNSYANLGIAWGDGDIRVTLHCNGPWGDAAVGGWYTYGTGCSPTITTSWCTY